MSDKSLQEFWAEARRVCQENKTRGRPQFPTGIATLDEVTGGIQKGEIWIISGRTGMGKTSLALQIARNCADNPNHSILFLSLEMKGWELALSMYSEMMEIDYSHLLHGKTEFEKADIFDKFIGGIDFEIAEEGYTIQEVNKIIEKWYQKKHPDIIFMDYIHLIDWRVAKNERLGLDEYMAGLKGIAKRRNIAIVIVSQIRRFPSGTDYTRPPDLIDLKGSGTLEQIADRVLFIYKHISGDKEEQYFINLAKNRTGTTINIPITFKGEYYKFVETPTSEPTEELVWAKKNKWEDK